MKAQQMKLTIWLVLSLAVLPLVGYAASQPATNLRTSSLPQ